MGKIELKPCMFCTDGGKPYMLVGKTYIYEDGNGAKVECSNCLACGPLMRTEQEAAEAWNTRHERTCKIESCEEFDERGIWAIELSCGHADVYCVMQPGHCSYCGAKVVS